MIPSKSKVGQYVITQLLLISCEGLKSIRIIMCLLPILYLFVAMLVGNGVVANTNQTCNQVAQLLLDRRVIRILFYLALTFWGSEGHQLRG